MKWSNVTVWWGSAAALEQYKWWLWIFFPLGASCDFLLPPPPFPSVDARVENRARAYTTALVYASDVFE